MEGLGSGLLDPERRPHLDRQDGVDRGHRSDRGGRNDNNREKLRGGFPHSVFGAFVHVELEVEDRAAARYRAGARRLGLNGRFHG